MTSHTPRCVHSFDTKQSKHRSPLRYYVMAPAMMLCILLISILLTDALVRGFWISDFGFRIDEKRSVFNPKSEIRNPKSADDLTLLEIGSPSAASHTEAPPELKIVSYNIRWRGGEDLQRIIELLRHDAALGGAHIIGLQEVDRNTKRNGNVNTARLIAEALGMHYAWAAPPHPDAKKQSKELEDETGVAILSLYPMTNVERLVLPNPGPGKRRRAAIGATLTTGAHRIRVYSVHAETRISTQKKVAQFAHVLDSLKQHTDVTRAIILGDFNTWQPDDKRDAIKLFTDATFSTPFKPGEETFRLRFVNWRLDWIWLRGFAPATANGVAREVKISDHYPLWLKVKLSQVAGYKRQ